MADYTLPRKGTSQNIPSFPDFIAATSSIASLKRKFEDAESGDILDVAETSTDSIDLALSISAGKRRASLTEVKTWESLDGDGAWLERDADF